MAYLRSKLLQTDGGLCHPALASLLAPIASGRAPLLGGHYPASSLLRAHPSGSRLRRASLLGSRDYLASAGFLRGARSPSLLHPMALSARYRPRPRRVVSPQVVFGDTCCLHRSSAGSAPGALDFGASSGRSLVVVARALADPAKRGFVGGLRRRDFSCRRHPSYAASTSCRLRTFTLWFHGYLQASLKKSMPTSTPR